MKLMMMTDLCFFVSYGHFGHVRKPCTTEMLELCIVVKILFVFYFISDGPMSVFSLVVIW